MTDDIVDRLRESAEGWDECDNEDNAALEREAADEIERLRAALTKIAAEAFVTHGSDRHMWKGWRKIATDRIDIARAALAGENPND